MSFRRRTVLVVDDNESFVMYICILLHRLDLDVLPAENGMEAIKISKLFLPDIILLDIKLPGMDGLSVLKTIKDDARTSNIPVIMVTAYSDRIILEECKKLGCSTFLQKPINITELHNSLQKYIVYSGGKNRKFLRASFEKLVAVTYNGVMQEYYAVSLSECGIYVRTKDPFPVGTNVGVALPFIGDKPLCLKGRVIYTRGIYDNAFRFSPGMAIQFKELTRSDFAMLKKYIIKLLALDIYDEQDQTIIKLEDIHK